MAKNLFDFGDEQIEDFLNKTNTENIEDENRIEEVKNVYEKYKDYSQEELMQEFLKTTRKKLSEGSLSIENLQNTINNLRPFLNSNQLEFLKDLMKKVDE